MYENLEMNGYPVIFSLRLVTEPGEGWKGTQYIGSYKTLAELNAAVNELKVPLYWMIEIDLEEKPND